jgi:hypothetical protein
MARTVPVQVVKSGDRATELVRSVALRLSRFGGHIEEGRGGKDLVVVFTADRPAARRFVREQLEDCGEDWTDYLHV